ncbi:MAG: phosphotransferase [Paludibacteraceae bacterium]|nr:phosphotransferase [Paludibacteraceae bacterium]
MIQQQGSNRVYSRVTDEQGRSLIRVEGTNRDENRAFIYMARHFHKLGLPVPELYTVSDDEMTYTQEDLGDTLLFDAIKHGRETGEFNETERTLLERTLRALAHIQVEGAKDFDWSICFPVPEMDERAIRWDLNYFKYCFLKGTKIEFSEPKLEDDFDRLVFNLTAERSVNCQLSTVNCQLSTFLYRDFQSRNVMIKDGKPYFIDFQGGRKGPTQYDVASFLWQAKANIPASLREELIDAYLDELFSVLCQQSGLCSVSEAVFKSAWRAALPHFVLLRTLQVLGAYGYRGYFERKPHFLESIPNALKNLEEIFTQNPELQQEYPTLFILSKYLPRTTVNRRSTDGQSQCQALVVTIYSFSFKRGIPADESGNGGGYVFDCRSTHNPGKYDEYKALTGLDQPVIDFLEKDGEILTFLNSVYALVDHHVERFLERGFDHLQVAFGCTGGQHRSVYCAEHLAAHLKEKYNVQIELIHRERGITKSF